MGSPTGGVLRLIGSEERDRRSGIGGTDAKETDESAQCILGVLVPMYRGLRLELGGKLEILWGVSFIVEVVDSQILDDFAIRGF